MNRKDALKKISGATLLPFLPSFAFSSKDETTSLAGKVNHSVCKWCYSDIPLEEMCEKTQDFGITSIELLGPEEWSIVQQYGLSCAMGNPETFSLTEGFNDPSKHQELQAVYQKLIPQAAEAGLSKIICFSGNRNALTDDVGLENCAIGLDPLVKLAQQHNITLCMELLNSKIDHKDYQCDHTSWGAALAEKLGSDHFKLLYDIYHMQIMEGDVIRTIRDNQQYIAHYHTGGVPGRNEIDDSQELNYKAIMEAIVATGYDGFVAQEFIPKSDKPLDSLKKAVAICDV